MQIVDPKTKKILGPHQPGEVCVAGPVIFDGYIGVDPDFDDEGFFKTGDIAYYDEDGFLFIVDRIKELIKYKAWQVRNQEYIRHVFNATIRLIKAGTKRGLTGNKKRSYNLLI